MRPHCSVRRGRARFGSGINLYPNVRVGLIGKRKLVVMDGAIVGKPKATMHIGELAERTGLSLRTIRHYDEVGILPATSRTEGGFRVYTEGDFERLMLIRRMKPLGFTLEEMQTLLSVTDALQAATDPREIADLRRTLASFRDSAVERREKLVQTLARADEFLDILTRY